MEDQREEEVQNGKYKSKLESINVNLSIQREILTLSCDAVKFHVPVETNESQQKFPLPNLHK